VTGLPLPLSLRLAVRRLRRADGVLSLGVALVALVLAFAAGVGHAGQVQAERLSARYGGGPGQPSGLLAGPPLPVGDRELTVLALAGGSEPPRFLAGSGSRPGPGQMLVSPALAEALSIGPDRDLLRARLPWASVGVLDEDVLTGPRELVAVVGADAAALPAAADAGPGAAPAADVGRTGLAVLTAVVLVPGFLLLVTCARVDARRRGQRLAALALIGASRRQLRRIAVAEAVLLTLPASLVGLLAARALTPVWSGTAPARRFPSEALQAPLWAWLVVPAVLAVLAAAAAVAAVRGVSAEPLARQRLAVPQPRPLRRVAPLALGVTGLLGAVAAAGRLPEPVLAAAQLVGLAAVLIGLPLAAPALVGQAAVLAARRRGLSGGGLVAARRLQRDPATGTRAVTGVVLATFVFGFASSLNLAAPARGGPEADVLVQPMGTTASAFVQQAAGLDGVRAVAPVRYTRTAPGEPTVLATTCAGALALLDLRVEQGQCRDGQVLVRTAGALDTTAGTLAVPVPAAPGSPPTALPVSGTFTGLPEDSGVDAVLALPLHELAALPTNEIRVSTDGTRETALQVIRASARTMPLALTGPPEIVLSSRPQAAAASQAVTLVLLAALSFAAAGLAVTVAEAALARGPVLALLEALGLGPAGARRMSAVEVGIPLVVLTFPALALGAGLAYLGGTLLGGDVQLAWARLAAAAAAVLALGLITFAAAVLANQRTPTAAILREDAL
jgi:hypothetical protein